MTRTTYALLLAGAFMIYASANSPVPIAGELRGSLGLVGDDAGLFMIPFAAGFGAGCLLWFTFARHADPGVLLPLALSLVAVGSIVLVGAGAPPAAGAARFAIGVASAAFPAAAQAMISQGAAPHLRGRLVGGFAAAVVAGGVLGQALVGVLADLSSPETSVIVICSLAPLLVAVGLRAALPRATRIADAQPQPVAHLIAEQWPPLLLAALMFGSYWLMLSQLTATVRADRFELSAAATGLLPILGVAGMLTTLGSGWLSDRTGPRLPVLVGSTLGVITIILTAPASTPLWLFAVAYGAFTAAYWGFLAPGASEVTRRAGERARQPAMMAFYAAAWAGAVVFSAAGEVLPGWGAAATLTAGAWAISAVVALVTFAAVPAGDPARASGEGPHNRRRRG